MSPSVFWYCVENKNVTVFVVKRPKVDFSNRSGAVRRNVELLKGTVNEMEQNAMEPPGGMKCRVME